MPLNLLKLIRLIGIIYEDRYSIGDVFFIFDYKSFLTFSSFGSRDYVLYDPEKNKFKEEVFKKSSAKNFYFIEPISYDDFNNFFSKLFHNYWTSKISYFDNLSNLVFDYMGIYRNHEQNVKIQSI